MTEKQAAADLKSTAKSDEKKLYIETYGCQMNVADSEVVASIMKMAGYEMTDVIADADAIFVNTCSVRDNAEQKIYSRLQYFHSLRKHKKDLIVGVLGCMAERVKEKLLDEHHVNLVAGPDSYMDLPNLIAAAEQGEKAINVELSTTETYREVLPLKLPGVHISGFVSIMRGCNNFCTYCIVPYTRGRERSRDVYSILKEIRDMRDKGFREVTLLGQNVNSYFFESDGGDRVDFPELRPLRNFPPEGYERRHPPRHGLAPEPLPLHPPPGAVRQLAYPPDYESQIHPRVVSRPHRCHPAHPPGLCDLDRPLLRLPLREGGGF